MYSVELGSEEVSPRGKRGNRRKQVWLRVDGIIRVALTYQIAVWDPSTTDVRDFLKHGMGLLAHGFSQVWAFCPSMFEQLRGVEFDHRILLFEESLNDWTTEENLKATVLTQLENLVSGKKPETHIFAKAPPEGTIPSTIRCGQRTLTQIKLNTPCLPWKNETAQAKEPKPWEIRVANHLRELGALFETQVTFNLKGDIPYYTADIWLRGNGTVIEPHGHLTDDFVRKMMSFKSACPGIVRVVMTDEDPGRVSGDF